MALDDLPEVLEKVHACWRALGRAERDPRQRIDWVIGASQRQCVVAKRDLRAGDVLSLDAVRFAFPCRGVPVEHWDLVDGAYLTRPVAAGTPVQWADVRHGAP